MPLVSFHDVEKTYRSLQGVDYPAVEHFSVEIEVGEFFCLLGPRGAAKPTGFKLRPGFEAPPGGQTALDGLPGPGPSRHRGGGFQGRDSTSGLVPAAENLEFGFR